MALEDDDDLHENDGSSPAKAIRVTSVRQEYEWMRLNCPGFKPGLKELREINGNHYDALIWQNKIGEERTVYFDISSFFLTAEVPCR